MGIFDKFKKKNEDEEEMLGWDFITQEAERIYIGQTDPKHYGALI